LHALCLGRHAIVIGASMGGLLAGRALAGYYNEVTLIDRDALPLTFEPRNIRMAFSLADEKYSNSYSRALPWKC
jgi:2-polyprenyl-6-methoxyphenol hydroxylase-like FAD-dependent oxidoreductase